MWFIKAEFWNEFQELINNYKDENEIVRKIRIVKAAESFSKQGKGISFYRRSVIDDKLAKEIYECKQDNSYYEYYL